jgi:hypothetical protein
MILAALPLDDWQFWVATALAAGSVWLVVRPLLPRRAKSAKPTACAGCPSSDRAGDRSGEDGADGKPRGRHVDLTIGGKRVKS